MQQLLRKLLFKIPTWLFERHETRAVYSLIVGLYHKLFRIEYKVYTNYYEEWE